MYNTPPLVALADEEEEEEEGSTADAAEKRALQHDTREDHHTRSS
jgi:hypothetical protein